MEFESTAALEKHLRERFTLIRAMQARVPAARDAARVVDASAVAREVLDLFPDARDAADAAERISDAAEVLTTPLADVALALRRTARYAKEDLVLHGTGSWALQGMLGDHALVPGGDGMTGETAMTNVVEPDVFVIEWTSPFAIYAALTFAYMNAAFAGEGMHVWAASHGHAPVEAVFSTLVFGEGEPVLPDAAQLAQEYRRVRDPDADRVAFDVLDRLVERARRHEIGRIEGLKRRLGPISPESMENNLLFAVYQLNASMPVTGARPSSSDVVLRWAPILRKRLLCPLPEDDAREIERKVSVRDALRKQHPVVIAIPMTAVDRRPDPTYAWSPERRVRGRLSIEEVTQVWVPDALRDETARAFAEAGHRSEMLPLEDLEIVRVAIEGPVLGPPMAAAT